MSTDTKRLAQKIFWAAAVAGLTLSHPSAHAATELSDVPLASSSSTAVKPNVLFILDDSGSMDWKYMPDNMSASTIGYRNNSCNYIYYNPAITYEIPKNADGTLLNSASQTAFTGAYNDGYHQFTSSSNSSTNLSSSFSADDDETSRAAYYWVLSNPTTDTSATTLTPKSGICNQSDSSVTTTTTGICCDTRADKNYNTSCSNAAYPTNSPATCAAGKTLVWKKTLVTSASGPGASDERQNFANWFSYYRNRVKMMKASAGRAMFSLGDNYRVGFMTIHPGSPVSASKFLKISDFDSTHRDSWFSKLYSQGTGSATPLRTALSVAGRYFAGKNDGINQGMVPTQADDPIQYSCQQNFAILTTDGYWNTGDSKALDGSTTLTNQDGNISELDAYNPAGSKFAVSARPMYDGATAAYTWNTLSNQYQTATCPFGTQWQQRTIQYQQCDNPTLAATGSRMRRNSYDSGATWSAWYPDAGCTVDNSGTNRRQCIDAVETRTSNNSGSSWTSWSTNPTPVCESDNVGTGRRQCQGGNITAYRSISDGDTATPTYGPWTATSSCNEDSNGGRECRYEGLTVYTCGGSWSNAQCTNTDTSTLPICQSTTGAWSDVGACTATSQDAGGAATDCQLLTVNGYKKQYKATITSKTYPGPNQTGSQIGSTQTNTSNWTDFDSPATCYSVAPALPANGTVTGVGPPDAPANCTSSVQQWPCETSSSTGGSSNTLADTAQYYYKTDLRTSALGNCTGALGGTLSTCDNNVPSTGTANEDDKANWQHMTTFTMGLGLSGTLTFSPTYKTDATGTFANIRSGSTNWPVPSSDDPTALDDLWHAAVNGRGQYFSARDPDSVIDSLHSALSGISARVASAAAAATSNLEPVAGDNFAYTAKYVTQKWTGELEAREINLATGAVSGTAIWSASTKLDALAKPACDNRVIKLFRSGAGNNLVDFKLSTYACDGSGLPTGAAVTTLDATEQLNFNAAKIALLSQYPNMGDGSGSTANQRAAAPGANLVNFLRGQTGKMGFDSGPPASNTDINKLYRTREHALGDIISAQPVFVKSPPAEYTDAGYVAFRSAKAGRTPMVYVAANDGMLHAFYAGTSIVDTQGGVEAWAFIPTMVLPNLYKLADENYDTHHQYYVDGTPSAADIFDKTNSADCALASPTAPENCWKTILVAGLNKGGQGYYALDITDPAAPKGLWEFKNSASCLTVNAITKAPTSTVYTDCHIGYTYNNPVIGKLADGTWVVLVTSGYNNDDGIGYLYVLNAATGQVLYRISTGTGSALSPSGLNHLNVWVDNGLFNNTIQRAYGVDLDGNVWRFDVNDTFGTGGREATLLAQVTDGSGTPQPITTKPELAEVQGAPFVYVGTGRYLGATDVSNTQQQSIWGIKDPMVTTPLPDLRNTLTLLHRNRSLTNEGSGTSILRTITPDGDMDCTVGDSWFIDLPDSGERVNVDPKLQLGTLVVPSNVPVSNACNIGGYSYLNFPDYKNGCTVGGAGNFKIGQKVVGASGVEAIVVGINIVRLPSGKTVVIITLSTGEQITFDAPFNTPPPVGKRVSWREILQ